MSKLQVTAGVLSFCASMVVAGLGPSEASVAVNLISSAGGTVYFRTADYGPESGTMKYPANDDTNSASSDEFASAIFQGGFGVTVGKPVYSATVSVLGVPSNNGLTSTTVVHFTGSFNVQIVSGTPLDTSGQYLVYAVTTTPQHVSTSTGPYPVSAVSGTGISFSAPLPVVELQNHYAFVVTQVAAGIAVPVVPLPPTPAATLVPSTVEEQLTTQAISQDFYLVNGVQDFTATSNSSGSYVGTINEATRINTVLNVNPGNAAWIELGDTAGSFGTSVADQTWFGHYYAWHGPDGSYGAETAGGFDPTGIHEFHIGPDGNGTGWQLYIDNSPVADVTDPPVAVGVRSDAYLANSDLAQDSFLSGTSISYLQYQDVQGDYNFWDGPSEASFLYPTALASFNAPSYAVVFTHD